MTTRCERGERRLPLLSAVAAVSSAIAEAGKEAEEMRVEASAELPSVSSRGTGKLGEKDDALAAADSVRRRRRPLSGSTSGLPAASLSLSRSREAVLRRRERVIMRPCGTTTTTGAAGDADSGDASSVDRAGEVEGLTALIDFEASEVPLTLWRDTAPRPRSPRAPPVVLPRPSRPRPRPLPRAPRPRIVESTVTTASASRGRGEDVTISSPGSSSGAPAAPLPRPPRPRP